MVLPNVALNDPHVAAHNAERAVINATETAVDTLETTTAGLTATTDALSTTTAGLTSSLATLDTNVDELTVDVTELTAEVTSLSETVDVLDPVAMGVGIGKIDPSRTGPVTTASEVTSVNIGAAADAALTKSYTITGAVYPANWPVEPPQGLPYLAGNNEVVYFSRAPGNRTIRVMTDAPKFQWGSNTVAAHGYKIWVDGRPTSIDPILSHTTVGFNNIVFPDARPRLIEIETGAGLYSVAVAQPYRCWKPVPRRGPRVVVMGDSYVVASGPANIQNGMYQGIGPLIGSDDVWLDGAGGTGYIQAEASNNNYLQRLTPYTYPASGLIWDIQAINPYMLVFHGGGTNDLSAGKTVSEIIDQAVLTFQTARTKLPKAKLVFVEGFSPPSRSTLNDEYIAIREAVQVACQGEGVYYVDVATTLPWLDGTGYAGAPSGSGNSDIYVSADATHYNDAGGKYLKGRIASKLRRILADQGPLLNQLV